MINQTTILENNVFSELDHMFTCDRPMLMVIFLLLNHEVMTFVIIFVTQSLKVFSVQVHDICFLCQCVNTSMTEAIRYMMNEIRANILP